MSSNIMNIGGAFALLGMALMVKDQLDDENYQPAGYILVDIADVQVDFKIWLPLLIASSLILLGQVLATAKEAENRKQKRRLTARTAMMNQRRLYRACESGYLKEIQMLHASGADMDVTRPDNHGWTPMLYACYEGHLEIVQCNGPMAPHARCCHGRHATKQQRSNSNVHRV
jgi:ankyrin repeat protein